jgi:hypothetical protein
MAQTSDSGVGLGLLFGIVAVGGAFALLVTGLQGQQVLSGWGFAGAMVAAALAVIAVHVY